MGKKKSDIYQCFIILPMKNKANKSIFQCRFCERQYLQNATKMESHIVTQCQRVPPEIRLTYTKCTGPSERTIDGLTMGIQQGNRPSPSLSDNSSTESRPETPINNLVIKRGAGGTLVSDIIATSRQHQVPAKKSKMDNGIITLTANQLRSIANNNNVGINNLNLAKYVQSLQKQQPQQQNQRRQRNNQNQQLYSATQQPAKKNNSSKGGIHINPKHMVPTTSTVTTTAHRQQHLGKNGNTGSSEGGGMAMSTMGMDGFGRTYNHKELVEVWSLLAKAIYATDCPLSLFESEHWKAAFKKIRPGLTLPTTEAISGSLLKAEYSELRKKLNASFESLKFVILHCTEKKDSNGQSFVSFFVDVSNTNGASLYRVIRRQPEQAGGDGFPSTTTALSSFACATVDAIGPSKVLAYVSDWASEADVSKTWESLRSSYPGLITFGCIHHGLNALLDCVLGYDKVNALCVRAKDIVDGTKSNPDLKKRFQELQRQLKLPPVQGFKFSSRSQWSPLAKCVALLVSQKDAFQALINESESYFQDACADPSIATGSTEFWECLTAAMNIIVPLSNWIRKVEGSCCIGEVPVIFHELKEVFASNIDNLSVLQESEREILKKKFIVIKRLCMNELHLAACLLTPLVTPDMQVLTSDEEDEGAEFIHFFCETKGYQAKLLLAQLSDYRNKTGEFVDDGEDDSVWRSVGSVNPLEWWTSLYFVAYPLAQVASHLLQISSCACTLTLPTPYDPVPLFDTKESLEIGINVDEKLALIRYYNQQKQESVSKLKTNATIKAQQTKEIKAVNGTCDPSVNDGVIPSLACSITRTQSDKHDNFSPGMNVEEEFRMEDHEPMDVTQFMKTETITALDNDDQDDGVETENLVAATENDNSRNGATVVNSIGLDVVGFQVAQSSASSPHHNGLPNGNGLKLEPVEREDDDDSSSTSSSSSSSSNDSSSSSSSDRSGTGAVFNLQSTNFVG